MSKRVKVGVLGVGVLGRHHARLYQQCAQADLAGVYDLNRERAAQIAEEVGTRVYPSPEALAADVAAVSIAVPSTYHFETAKTMLNMGKHLLIEKPIATNMEEAETMLAMAREKQLIIQVGHVERFNPVISYLEEKLNNPRFIECHRLSAYPPPRPGLPPRGTEVGVVLDLMIHDIDMVLNLVKSEVVSVDAVGIPVLSPTEDIANARFRFKNGCVANLTASRVTPEPMRKIRLFQNDCYISMDYNTKSGEIFIKEDKGIVKKDLPINDHNALLKQLEHFVACVAAYAETGKMPTPKVSGEHGMRALKWAIEVCSKMEAGEALEGPRPS